MDVEHALQRLQAAKVRPLALASLKTDEALQPRDARMVPVAKQAGLERRSEEAIGTMRLALEARQTIQLEPVLVAEIDGASFIVDGHHRLRAYKLAQRVTIPARVLPMTKLGAVMVSKLVNCTGRALEMHAEQRRDAAWQYMAAVMHRGANALPKGESLRAIAGRFGVSRDTVDRMKRKMPEVNPKDWDSTALDPGTGFPRWRYVREGGAGWRDMKEMMSMDTRIQHEAEKMAKKIGALMEKAFSPEIGLRALQMLWIEDQLEAKNKDTLTFKSETAEVCDF